VTSRALPLDLPLAGGKPDARVRLHPLMAAETRMPPSWYARPSGPLSYLRGLGVFTPRSKWFWAPIPAFLIEHPSVGPILIDTGLHPSVADDPVANLGRRGAALFKTRMTSEQAVGEQARARGVDPKNIGHVIMTHLHWDHASGISEFPGATFIVNKAEWESAAKEGFLKGYNRSHLHPLYDWRTIDFLSDSVASFDSFGRAVDLFGDGSVRLLFTPGHTKGHTSVLLRVSAGEVLLTADAAYARRTIAESLIPPVVDDEHFYRRSLKEIQRYVEARPDVVVIPGHDPDAWAQLEEVY
jgi:glyoxylase-like metal-dependent hydrolase (beta-lactamase superfamily II)